MALWALRIQGELMTWSARLLPHDNILCFEIGQSFEQSCSLENKVPGRAATIDPIDRPA